MYSRVSSMLRGSGRMIQRAAPTTGSLPLSKNLLGTLLKRVSVSRRKVASFLAGTRYQPGRLTEFCRKRSLCFRSIAASWSGNLAFSIKEIPRDSCSSTRLGTHRYSGDDSQSGRGTQADTYSDRTRPQGASSDPGEGARHGTSCLGAGRSGQSDRGGRGMERRHPRASNSLKRSLPRKNVSSICCPVTSSASRLVLLNWPPLDHLWIGTKSRHVLLPQRVTNARASIPAETAAQTRIVSVDRIRLDPWKSVRPFKGIFCHDMPPCAARVKKPGLKKSRGGTACSCVQKPPRNRLTQVR